MGQQRLDPSPLIADGRAFGIVLIVGDRGGRLGDGRQFPPQVTDERLGPLPLGLEPDPGMWSISHGPTLTRTPTEHEVAGGGRYFVVGRVLDVLGTAVVAVGGGTEVAGTVVAGVVVGGTVVPVGIVPPPGMVVAVGTVVGDVGVALLSLLFFTTTTSTTTTNRITIRMATATSINHQGKRRRL
jgi:hypothetical protein